MDWELFAWVCFMNAVALASGYLLGRLSRERETRRVMTLLGRLRVAAYDHIDHWWEQEGTSGPSIEAGRKLGDVLADVSKASKPRGGA